MKRRIAVILLSMVLSLTGCSATPPGSGTSNGGKTPTPANSVSGPAALSLKDAAVGPVSLRMDWEAALKALGKGYSEGSLSPYMKFTYTQSGIELQADNAVKAIFLSKKTDLATPRGIQVGNTAEDLRKAFGEPQVSSKGGNEIWAYESTGDGFGLFFWLKAKRVEVIGLLAADYQFRPTK